VSVAKTAHFHNQVTAAGRYGVSILAAGCEALSNHFAGRPMADAEVVFRREGVDTPVLADALAWLDCALENAVEAGDHTLFLGRVLRLGHREGEPLLYFRGKYREIRAV
jgi:flavin reductase (DIM6/NTAB) family NADH-FMN oxidoreductase RutF